MTRRTRPACCVGGIIRSKGKLLLVRRGKPPGEGYWSIPGGHVEPGETWQSAVEREIHEETGLIATCGEFVGWVERYALNQRYVIADFLVEAVNPELAEAGDDALEVILADKTDMQSLQVSPGLTSFLDEYGLLGS